MSSKPDQIPLYAPDGRSLGFRSRETALRLLEAGHVTPAYGRKRHLKAIWLRQDDGSSPVESRPRAGTKYSYIENLEHGRCWRLRRVRLRDEDGVVFTTHAAFLAVLNGCLVKR